MSKVIRLTESDLHNMIKEAINELDWRTYASAAKKDNRGRSKDFKDAAVNSFEKKYNSGLGQGHKIKCSPNGHCDIHGFAYTDKFVDDNHFDYDDSDNLRYSIHNDNFYRDRKQKDIDNITKSLPRNRVKQAAKDLKSFTDDKSHYNKDTHAWENDED